MALVASNHGMYVCDSYVLRECFYEPLHKGAVTS